MCLYLWLCLCCLCLLLTERPSNWNQRVSSQPGLGDQNLMVSGNWLYSYIIQLQCNVIISFVEDLRLHVLSCNNYELNCLTNFKLYRIRPFSAFLHYHFPCDLTVHCPTFPLEVACVNNISYRSQEIFHSGSSRKLHWFGMLLELTAVYYQAVLDYEELPQRSQRRSCRSDFNPRTGGGLSQPRTGGGGVDFSPPLRSRELRNASRSGKRR